MLKPKVTNWNLPNALTMVRLALVPAFGWMLLAHPSEPSWRTATAVVFVIAAVTDFVDGKLARKYGQVTDFGKLWDPAADKAFTGMAFIGLSILGELPWWVSIIILVREWGITALRAAIVKYGVMAAKRGGKLKTAIQCVALTLYLLWLPRMPLPVQWVAWITMGLAFVLTVVTGIDYLFEAARLRRDALARPAEEDAADAD